MCNLVRRAPSNLEKVAKIQWRKINFGDPILVFWGGAFSAKNLRMAKVDMLGRGHARSFPEDTVSQILERSSPLFLWRIFPVWQGPPFEGEILPILTLKTRTSLNKEVRPCFPRR